MPDDYGSVNMCGQNELEFLKELVPATARLAVLSAYSSTNTDVPGTATAPQRRRLAQRGQFLGSSCDAPRGPRAWPESNPRSQQEPAAKRVLAPSMV